MNDRASFAALLLALTCGCGDKGEVVGFLCAQAGQAASVGSALLDEPHVAVDAVDPELLAIAAQECNQARDHYMASAALLGAAQSSDNPKPIKSERLAAAHKEFVSAAEGLCPRPPDYVWTHDGKLETGSEIDRKKEMQTRIDRMGAAQLEMGRACFVALGGNAPAKGG